MNHQDDLLRKIEEYGFQDINKFFEYVDQLKYSQEIEKGFIEIANLLPDAVIITNESGIIQYCNNSATKMFQWDNLIGESVIAIMPEKYRDKHSISMNKSSSQVYKNEIRYFYAIKKNGEEFPISISAIKYKKNGTNNYIAIIRDISPDYKQLEILKSILQELPIMIVITNSDKVEFVNEEFSRITELTIADINSNPISEFFIKKDKADGYYFEIVSKSGKNISSFWYTMSLGNKVLNIGSSRSEMLVRDALNIVIEAKYGSTNT
jgi:PAS domain S-box-containing protein